MNLVGEILPLENILPNLAVASKKRVFEEVGLLIEARTGLPHQEVFDCLFAREKLGSTGLGQGVAIPHGRFAKVTETIAAFVRLPEPIPFDAPDNKPVNLIFALLVPENATGKHLEVLSHLADLFSSKEAREALSTAPDAAGIYEILTKER